MLKNINQIIPDFRGEYSESLINGTVIIRLVMLQVVCLGTMALYQYVFVRRVKWQGREFSVRNFLDEIFKQILYICALFAFGNYGATLTLLNIPIIPAAAIGFGALGEVQFLRNNLTNCFRNPRAIAVYSAGAFIVLLLAAYHFFEAYTADASYDCCPWAPTVSETCDSALPGGISIWYATALVSVLLILLALSLPAFVKSDINFHPHHWAIFYILALFTRFPTVISEISAYVCIGIYVQGVATFGSESALY